MPSVLKSISKTPKLFLGNIDKAHIEKLIAKEKSNLSEMYWQFLDNFVLCRLQLKLINALKSLLKLLNKPDLSLQELIQQLLKVSAIYSEVNSELDKAKQRHQELAFELQAQQKKADEHLISANESYYDEKNSSYRQHAQAEREKRQVKEKEAEEAAAIKQVLIAQRNAKANIERQKFIAEKQEQHKRLLELSKLNSTVGLSISTLKSKP